MALSRQRLMACGTLCCGQATKNIMRGMMLFDHRGHPLGQVAALLEDAGQLSYLLLSDPATPHCYRLIPIERICKVTPKGIVVTLEPHELSLLEVHDPHHEGDV